MLFCSYGSLTLEQESLTQSVFIPVREDLLLSCLNMKPLQLTSHLSLEPPEFSRAATWLFIPTCEGSHFLEFARGHCFGTICFNMPAVFVLNSAEQPLHFNEERRMRINWKHRSLWNLVMLVSLGLHDPNPNPGQDRQDDGFKSFPQCYCMVPPIREKRAFTSLHFTHKKNRFSHLFWCSMCVSVALLYTQTNAQARCLRQAEVHLSMVI